MSDVIAQLDAIATKIIDEFEINTPPIPIETILQNPKPNMWAEVNVSQLTGSFLSVKEQYGPRMSLARMLARHILNSQWGEDHQLTTLINSEEMLQAFARMLIMPRDMIDSLSNSSRNPVAMSMHFEVTESEAHARLLEIS